MKKEQKVIAKMTSHWLRTMIKRWLTRDWFGTVIIEDRRSTQAQNWRRLANTTIGLLVNWFSWLQMSIINCIILASISQQRSARRCLKRVKAITAQQRPARRSLKQREANIYHQNIARSSLKRIKASTAQQRSARRSLKRVKATIGTTTESKAF